MWPPPNKVVLFDKALENLGVVIVQHYSWRALFIRTLLIKNSIDNNAIQ